MSRGKQQRHVKAFWTAVQQVHRHELGGGWREVVVGLKAEFTFLRWTDIGLYSISILGRGGQ